jgi:glycosyltransferase involved in cell wall biosynthesis
VTSLLKGIDRSRFDIALACHSTGPMLDEYRRLGPVALFDLSTIFNCGSLLGLLRLIRRLDSDIVHTHLWNADVLGGLAAAFARAPIRVATVHGENFRLVNERRFRRMRKIALSLSYRSIYRLFDKIIGVSNSIGYDLCHRPGVRVDARKFVAIHNGIDSTAISNTRAKAVREELGLAQDAPLVVTVANFFPMKGYPWLVAAIPRVLERIPNSTFLFVGGGPDLRKIRTAVSGDDWKGRVLFAGSRRDAIDWLAAGDVVVLPSVAAEGLPIVILEALSLSRPVIATRIGGIPEIIQDRESGLLVPANDSGALAESIISLLCDRAFAETLGYRGREVVRERFSVDAMIAKTEMLYSSLAKMKGIDKSRGAGKEKESHL